MTKVAAIQMAMGLDEEVNIAKAKALTLEAVANGAKIILLPELMILISKRQN